MSSKKFAAGDEVTVGPFTSEPENKTGGESLISRRRRF